MDRWLPTIALLAGACGFQATVTPVGQVDAAVDGPPLVVDGVVHVATADEALGDADLTVSAAIAIDTDALTLGMTPPAGVTFAMARQDGGGPDLAILHVRTFDVEAPMTVHGTRPLVVIADNIIVSKDIDAGAHQGTPGPGAQTSGPGVGGVGAHFDSYTDSGGGGGGYATTAGAGGNVFCATCANVTLAGGVGGAAYNTSGAELVGGSSGGRPYEPNIPACVRSPGAGGGALELYARTRIAISANINVGGGGGAGGIGVISSTCGNNFLAGYGGGSGGSIVLQSPVLDISGRLSANGGGGGGGGGAGLGGARTDGGAGSDGAPGTTVAVGGTAPVMYAGIGGNGGAGPTPPTGGGNAPASGNGGGGGGAYGQIILLYKSAPAVTGVISPAAIMKNY